MIAETATLSELLPVAKALPRAEQFRLIQLFTADLAKDEMPTIPQGIHEVWFPIDNGDTAKLLRDYLEHEELDV